MLLLTAPEPIHRSNPETSPMRRIIVLLTTLFLEPLAASGCSAASPALTFTGTDGQTTTIPFLLRNNHVYVRGTVNASDSLWFFVDTGAGSNVISTESVPRLKLKTEGLGEAHGAGGTVQASRVVGATIRVAGLQFGDVLTASVPLEAVATQVGLPVEGIVGSPLFQNSVVEFDYARSVLVVHKPGSFRYAGPGKAVPIEIRANQHPYVTATVTLAGGKPITEPFVIDTGSSSALILGPEFVEKHNALASLPNSVTGRSGGVGGSSFNPVGRVTSLAIGSYALQGPITTFMHKTGGTISEATVGGNIGGDILRRFKVIFDYKGKTMTLEPNALYGTAFEADMTGIVPQILTDGSRGVAVAAIQPDSPASEAGVQVGDVLESVDGAPLDAGSLADVRSRTRQPGVTVRFGLRRGVTRSEVTLVTRRLI
jgi:hypothetical protein